MFYSYVCLYTWHAQGFCYKVTMNTCRAGEQFYEHLPPFIYCYIVIENKNNKISQDIFGKVNYKFKGDFNVKKTTLNIYLLYNMYEKIVRSSMTLIWYNWKIEAKIADIYKKNLGGWWGYFLYALFIQFFKRDFPL